MSTSLQTTLAADTYLAEGSFSLEEQTLKQSKVSDIPSRKSKPTISKTAGHNLEKL
jgi:hypothetical protein